MEMEIKIEVIFLPEDLEDLAKISPEERELFRERLIRIYQFRNNQNFKEAYFAMMTREEEEFRISGENNYNYFLFKEISERIINRILS